MKFSHRLAHCCCFRTGFLLQLFCLFLDIPGPISVAFVQLSDHACAATSKNDHTQNPPGAAAFSNS